MNYIDAVNYIHSLLKFGVRPGLSGMNALLHLLGNPQETLKFVHVAGTNGKGSTSTAISNVLIDAGYNTGLYTSPYVCEFLERVQYNGAPVNKNCFAESVAKVKDAVEALEHQEIVITEFEALTAAAFLCFTQMKCDVVVLEVGLGGRLDATNVIKNPLVNVITSLSLDHTAILGNTIEEITFEKCGTLKENCKAVVSFGQSQQSQKIISETVSKQNGILVIPEEKDISVVKSDLFGTEFSYKNEIYSVIMPGLHQVKNMTCVIECCEILKENFNISLQNIKNGILKTVLPARVEVLCSQPLVILDGGHNKDGAKAFFDVVKNHTSSYNKIIVVAGMMKDKEVEDSLEPLIRKSDIFYCVTPDNPRAMTASELFQIAEKYTSNVVCASSVKDALDDAFSVLSEKDALFVVGSLYLAGEVRGHLVKKLNNIH